MLQKGKEVHFFVTGGTGFVGSWVVELLCQMGARVTCLVRASSNLRWIEHLPVRFHQGSLLEPASLRPALREADYLLHIAGVTKTTRPYDFYRGNVETTAGLLEAAHRYGTRVKQILHLSSQAAVGPSPTPQPLDETAECHPVSEYGRSKLQAEQLVRSWMDRLPITILRPPAVYGPRDTDVLEVFKNVQRGLDLRVGGTEQQVSMIHVQDLARAILLAATDTRARGQTYFVCNLQAYRWGEVIHLLARLMNTRVRTLRIPVLLAYTVATFMEAWADFTGKPTILNRDKIREVAYPYWVISGQRIRRELGFTPSIPLEQGLAETYQWYCQQGWLRCAHWKKQPEGGTPA